MNKTVTSRQDILDASVKIAVSDGIQSINMRSVAAVCGVAVGSVYYYFPSKADLVGATVEAIWKSIFHEAGDCRHFTSFTDCTVWMFDRISRGLNEYPSFFAAHSLGFERGEKGRGRQIMNDYFQHMKSGLLEVLQKDRRIDDGVFDEHFTRKAFVDFVFSNLLTLLMREEQSCQMLVEVEERVLYPDRKAIRS